MDRRGRLAEKLTIPLASVAGTEHLQDRFRVCSHAGVRVRPT
jgi:hypothetical protein